MSAWAIFSMMGFYPDIPGIPTYTVTTPAFDKVTIHLNRDYYPVDSMVVEVENPDGGDFIDAITVGGKKSGYRVGHGALVKGGMKIRKK